MSLNNIEETFQRLSKLGHLSSIVGWDEAVNMSKDGGEKRAQAMAELMVIKSELINDPKLAESFQSINGKVSGFNRYRQTGTVRFFHPTGARSTRGQ